MRMLSRLIRAVLKALKWLTHPIFVFVALQFVWLAITVMWVVWFVDSVEEMTKLARSLGVQYLDNQYALAMLIGGCVLLGVLLVGTVMLFVFGQRQSYRMSQQKSFVSSVTHELRSPLASLQLAFDTLRTRQLSPEQHAKMLGMAGQDIERLTRLVNQILVSARLDRGIIGFTEEAQPLQVRDFISQSGLRCQWLDPAILERLQLICDPELTMQAAPAVISLIVTNLIENAIKYSPARSPITIRVTRASGFLTFAVQDEGFGLSPRDIKRIFRMFHRAAITHKKAIPGTGLGLFMVRALAESQGGRAWAESRGPGQGSTFFVSLPEVAPTPK